MAPCKGCQKVRSHIFNSSERLGKKAAGVVVEIHENYEEPSACAEAGCNLCKFLRREIWYCSYFGSWNDGHGYTFRQKIHTSDSKVKIELGRFGPGIPLIWSLNVGDLESFPYKVMPSKSGNEHPGNVSFEQQVELASGWLETCRATHEQCRQSAANEPGYLPTRLLDVGPSGQPSVRLIISRDLNASDEISYITLSYCWGVSNKAACTTKANLDERKRAISISSLPQTLQDAITVTRAFGVRYLWIDALCIVQVEHGENEDWKRELPNMGKIYRNSLFTIAASSGEDSNAGLFRRSEAACWPVRNYYIPTFDNSTAEEGRMDGKEEHAMLVPTSPSWYATLDRSPLSRRGWVYQERMLTSRTLAWTEDGLFWQCGEFGTSEYDETDSSDMNPLNQVVFSVRRNDGKSSGLKGHWLWSDPVVEEFSSKALTVSTDRLPAIMGLGEEIARMSGKQYTQGIFTDNIVVELAWARFFQSDSGLIATEEQCQNGSEKPVQQLPRLPGVPSWSWGSVNYGVTFRIRGQCQRNMATEASVDGQRIRVCGRLGSLTVKNSRKSSFLANGRPARLPQYSFELSRPSMEQEMFDESAQFAIFDTWEDTLPEEDKEVLCVEWMRWEDYYCMEWFEYGWDITGAIIVSPVDGEANVYRRIGWLEAGNADFFQKESQEIILV